MSYLGIADPRLDSTLLALLIVACVGAGSILAVLIWHRCRSIRVEESEKYDKTEQGGDWPPPAEEKVPTDNFTLIIKGDISQFVWDGSDWFSRVNQKGAHWRRLSASGLGFSFSPTLGVFQPLSPAGQTGLLAPLVVRDEKESCHLYATGTVSLMGEATTEWYRWRGEVCLEAGIPTIKHNAGKLFTRLGPDDSVPTLDESGESYQVNLGSRSTQEGETVLGTGAGSSQGDNGNNDNNRSVSMGSNAWPAPGPRGHDQRR